ncbi:MAG: alpha/beta hydrolase [Anaerolineales bacterium]|nr:alpha/beta hydrolase [Anaerolineales bacterium]
MPRSADFYYYHYYANQGQAGLPIVLLHGAGGNYLSWQMELRRMPGFRIYALDLPGHGKSGGRGLQSIEAYAERVLFWMNVIRLPAAVMIGHSMGSAIAMWIALKHPDQLLGLGLVGAAARLRVSQELLQDASSPTTVYSAIEKIVRWSFSPAAPQRIVNSAIKHLGETRQSVLYGDLVACNTFDITDKVSAINVPTVVICGEGDKMTPLRHSQFLKSQISGASLHIIPNAGHMVMLEKGLQVANIIKSFLKTIKN